MKRGRVSSGWLVALTGLIRTLDPAYSGSEGKIEKGSALSVLKPGSIL